MWKIDKSDHIKIKTIFTSKETTSEKQHEDWEEIFAGHTYDKRLICKIKKKLK